MKDDNDTLIKDQLPDKYKRRQYAIKSGMPTRAEWDNKPEHGDYYDDNKSCSQCGGRIAVTVMNDEFPSISYVCDKDPSHKWDERIWSKETHTVVCNIYNTDSEDEIYSQLISISHPDGSQIFYYTIVKQCTNPSLGYYERKLVHIEQIDIDELVKKLRWFERLKKPYEILINPTLIK